MTTEDLDVVELLRRQHQHIRILFSQVREASETEDKQRRFEELRRFLAVHETAEELVTHPRARVAAGGNAVVAARLEEEDEAKQLLATLDGSSVADAGFDDRLATLEQAVLAHAEAEEREEFPLLEAVNDEREKRVLADAVRAAEAIAPTHPHPSVGSSMTTNLLAGPVASLVDRTRDAVSAVLGRRR